MKPVVMWEIDPRAAAAQIAPSPRRDLVERLGIHSVMVIPLKAQGELMGIVTVARRLSGTRRPYQEADLALLEELAGRAGLVMKEWRSFKLVEEARQRLTVIGDSLPVLVSLIDREQRYQFANATYERWFGRKPVDIIGKTLEEVLGVAAYQAILPRVKTVLSGRPITYEERVSYSMGGERYVRASYIPYLVGGRLEGFVALVTDISELRAAVTLRDDFLSIASHELRTPLTALQLQLDSLGRNLEGSPELWSREGAIKKVATALRQTDRLTALVEGLLDVSRLSTGALLLDPVDFDLVGLVHEIAERFAEQARLTGSAIQLSMPRSFTGRWDRSRVDQAITNLLSNALKYGGGRPVEIALSGGPDQVNLTVRDQGIGIAPADLNRIFGRFERAVSSTNYGGLGLGLYITGQMIAAHGGTIDVQSRLGDGATFTVKLPRHTSLQGGPIGLDGGARPS
jgi:PAS domain S-box-containing protein